MVKVAIHKKALALRWTSKPMPNILEWSITGVEKYDILLTKIKQVSSVLSANEATFPLGFQRPLFQVAQIRYFSRIAVNGRSAAVNYIPKGQSSLRKTFCNPIMCKRIFSLSFAGWARNACPIPKAPNRFRGWIPVLQPSKSPICTTRISGYCVSHTIDSPRNFFDNAAGTRSTL